jgi:CubicO group peptidase (beta-lactamase class C family)
MLGEGRRMLEWLALLAVASSPASVQQRVSALVAPLEAHSIFSGSVVVERKAHVIAERQAGFSDREHGERTTQAAVFYVASVTKSFTAAGILLLRDEGELSLGDAVGKFIPTFPHPEITVRQLLEHTSGLQHPVFYSDFYELAKRPYTAADAVKLFQDRPVLSSPGTKRRYSDYNYVLLARIIEVASHKTYSQFVSERFFKKLGMQSAGNHESWAMLVPNRSRGYQPVGLLDFENAQFFDYSISTGAASIYMSARDLTTWVTALGSGAVLSAQSTRELLGTRDLPGILHGTEIAGHWAIELSGWDNIGFGAEAVYFPAEALSVVVTANVNDSGVASYLVEAVSQTVLTQKPARPLEIVVTPKAAQRFAGRYKFGDDFYVPGQMLDIVWRDGALFDHQTKPERWMALVALADGTFMYRSHWGAVEFAEDAGRAESVTLSNFKAVRVAD